jgi:hypothetical protein
MPGEERRTLWCLIEGNPQAIPFDINVGAHFKINHLKKTIKNDRSLDVDLTLVLSKVRIFYRLA